MGATITWMENSPWEDNDSKKGREIEIIHARKNTHTHTHTHTHTYNLYSDKARPEISRGFH